MKLFGRATRKSLQDDWDRRGLPFWSNESLQSSVFQGFHLSDMEFGLQNHHDEFHKRFLVMEAAGGPAVRKAKLRLD